MYWLPRSEIFYPTLDLDFIPDIDGNFVSPRSNPDQLKNSHGNYFLQFLKDNRALICNGRITPDLNDFTFLSTRGRSVPDYIYCPADQIHLCKELKVVKVSDIILYHNLAVPTSIPDHSLLCSTFDISTNEEFLTTNISTSNTVRSLPQSGFIRKKKNIKKIDDSFFTSREILEEINRTIIRIEALQINQNTLNDVYSEIKSIFLNEMSKLPDLPCGSKKGIKRLKRKSHEF